MDLGSQLIKVAARKRLEFDLKLLSLKGFALLGQFHRTLSVRLLPRITI